MRLAGLALAFAGIALGAERRFHRRADQGRVAGALPARWPGRSTFLLTSHFFHGRDARPVTLHMTATAGVVFVRGVAAVAE